MKYLQIKYKNSCDLAGSVFQTGFQYVFFLDVDPGKPEYEIVEEGRENGNKDFVADFRKITKRYKFNTVVPEYQLDALMNIMIHDTIFVRLKNDEESRVFNFKVEPGEWLNNGSMNNVSVSFTTNYDIATGCCGDEKLNKTHCYTCTNIAVIGWIDYTNTIYQDPIANHVSNGSYYLVSKTIGGILVKNTLFRYSFKSGWIKYTGRGEQQICFTLSGIAYKFYWDGSYWIPVMFIRDVNLLSGTETVRVWCYPNCFVQLYVSTDGINYVSVGVPTQGATAQNAGIKKTGMTSGTYYFKALVYNNNCNYGYTNVVTVVV